MKKYTAPEIEVTKIEIESAILAASLDYMDGEITDEKKILSNKAFLQFLEEEGE